MGELSKKEKEELLQAIADGLESPMEQPGLIIVGKVAGRMPQCSFVQLKKVIFDDKFPARQAMENVLSTFTDPHFNLVYLLMCKDSHIELMLGAVRNIQDRENIPYAPPMPVSEKANMLSNALRGNYHGSEIKHLKMSDTEKLFSDIQQFQKFSLITGMPCLSEEKPSDGTDFQGIDRLINACIKREWALMVICEPVPRKTVRSVRGKLCDIYDYLAETSKTSIQQNQNTATSEMRGKSETDHGNVSRQEQKSTNKGSGNAVSYEKIRRQQQDCMRYIEDTLLQQLDEGMGKGMFQTTVYAMAKDDVSLGQVQSLFCSIFQGRANPINPLIPCHIPGGLQLCMQSDALAFAGSGVSNLLLGHLGSGPVSSATLLDARTLSMIAAIPQREVPGLAMREGVGFGLNTPEVQDGIELGCLLDRGRKLHRVSLSKETLCKHIFVGGVTGSGKTTTCQTLLGKAGLPFIVIEPAKTEYRAMCRLPGMEELRLFTFGDETRLPFRLNPFELFPGENLSAHVDMLKACFVNAMPMEAALPMVFEEALYRCYQFYGWNTEEGDNRLTDNPFTEDRMYFPILQDMIPAIREVAAEKHFSATMQGDYIGSLVGRISNLLVGTKGRMLNCRRSFDILELLDGKAVLELEELKAPQDKAFVMGLLLSRISEGLKRKHALDPGYRHITLVEEAHRLLSKPDLGEGGARKNSVEIFTDLLAETRKYGEALVVVDQIPNKLAPEVLKNTNTKIIHRLFAKDDKDAVGNTILLDQKQREYLSSLAVGEVVLFSEDFEKPVNVRIKGVTNTARPEDPRVMDAYFEQQRTQYANYLVHCAPHLHLTPAAAARITRCEEAFELWRKTLYTVLPTGRNKQEDGSILEKVNDAGRTLVKVIQKAADPAVSQESDIWDELVWRFILQRGIVARAPAGRKWRDLYQTWRSWYEVRRLQFGLADLEMLRELRSQQILGIKGEELPSVK